MFVIIVLGWLLPNLPWEYVYAPLMIVGIGISQHITANNPSGVFILHGRNWRIFKWIGRGKMVVGSIYGVLTHNMLLVEVLLLAAPVFEIVMRRFGNYNKDQESVYRKNAMRGRGVTVTRDIP